VATRSVPLALPSSAWSPAPPETAFAGMPPGTPTEPVAGPPTGALTGGSGGKAVLVAGCWGSVTRSVSVHPGLRVGRSERSVLANYGRRRQCRKSWISGGTSVLAGA